jgi:hypothetical protein
VNQPAQKSFRRQVFITRDDLLAARWWHEDMQASVSGGWDFDRRKALKGLFVLGGIAVGAVVISKAVQALNGREVSMDALELQMREGWSVGASDRQFTIPYASFTDSQGDRTWTAHFSTLADELAPGARLEPFYVPTLFNVLKNPRGAGVMARLQPMHTASMEAAQMAAEALATLFTSDEDWKSTALILDISGPESVAAAAGVARVFAPVFLFDNWPHPLGVVPSHEILAASLFHRPDFVMARENRDPDAGPAFVLDNRRLDPYRDGSDRFDNRYVARMPSAEALANLGVRRVMLVTQVPVAHEEDDLNDDMVALAKQNIPVKMIALSDFSPASPEVLSSQNLPPTTRTYYYGGHPGGFIWFHSSYGGYTSRTLVNRTLPARPLRPVSGGAGFAPVSRPTMFSSRTVGGLGGVGKQKPSGFGRVSYRAGSNGSFRSGSFGRTRSGGYG